MHIYFYDYKKTKYGSKYLRITAKIHNVFACVKIYLPLLKYKIVFILFNRLYKYDESTKI